MLQEKELKALSKQVADDHRAVMREIQLANKDIVERAKQSGFTFDLDKEADTLCITLGTSTQNTYTQADEAYVYADIDLETNKITAFTILEFQAAFLKTKPGKTIFGEGIILPVLLRYGTVSFPPEREGTRKAASDLRKLVPVAV